MVVWRSLAQRGADLLGYEAFPKWVATSKPMATRLKALFDHCRIERVIDIGANKGQYRDFLRDAVEFKGPIHSFEPDPDLASFMRGKAAQSDPNWTVSELALGDTARSAIFHRMSQPAYNSFLSPKAGPKFDPQNSVRSTFEVVVKRIDDLALGDMSRSFVKIDTQGFDLKVLEGGPQTFATVPLVQAEVSFIPIYEDMPTWRESMEGFFAADYMLADMFMVGGPIGGAAHEMDMIVIKSALR